MEVSENIDMDNTSANKKRKIDGDAEINTITKGVYQGVQKFGQTRAKFAVGRDCMQKHFSKYEIEKNVFLGP